MTPLKEVNKNKFIKAWEKNKEKKWGKSGVLWVLLDGAQEGGVDVESSMEA
jgi:hypothetical protein